MYLVTKTFDRKSTALGTLSAKQDGCRAEESLLASRFRGGTRLPGGNPFEFPTLI
jgi:hypothetical protein